MAGNSVPAFFGAKAQTRKPSAVDVTITYDHSASNSGFIGAFRSIDNIIAMEQAMALEGVGAGTDKNRYSMTSFEFIMHTLLNNQARVWINSTELQDAGLEWADSRNVAFNGTSDEDETGAIYNLLTGSRSSRTTKTLVPNIAVNWPRTSGSWPSAFVPIGPVIDGTYRASPTNTIRGIIISQSTEEQGADSAIDGTYGIANGPINSDYNLDNKGPSDGADNNTDFELLSNALDDPRLRQILVFVDTVTIGCTIVDDHVAQGLIPDNTYGPVGVVFPSQTAATLIYAPNRIVSSEATTFFVPNVPLETLTGLSPDAPGTASATNTYFYAKKSNGAVLAQNSVRTNYPVTFWALGRVIGKFLYDTSF